MLRRARFRGLWYPYSADDCMKTIGDGERCGNAIHGVLPHAGWPYSSPMIREYFDALSDKVKRFIVISPSHYHYLMPDTFTLSRFTEAETPFGNADVHGLSFRSSVISDRAIADEHGVEVVLPFIGERKASVSFALISEVTSLEAADRLSDELIAELDDESAVIASSDFTHYGRRFGYTPYKQDALEKTIRSDSECASALAEGRCEDVFRKFRSGTICGIAASIILSMAARKLGLNGVTGSHSTSADATGDDEDFVSYQTVYWRQE